MKLNTFEIKTIKPWQEEHFWGHNMVTALPFFNAAGALVVIGGELLWGKSTVGRVILNMSHVWRQTSSQLGRIHDFPVNWMFNHLACEWLKSVRWWQTEQRPVDGQSQPILATAGHSGLQEYYLTLSPMFIQSVKELWVPNHTIE